LYDSFIEKWKEYQIACLWDQLLALISSPIQPVFASQTTESTVKKTEIIQPQSSEN
jgi:hypothetical protein